MNIAKWTFLFSFLTFLASCQVKENAGSVGLISGHLPATNAFTLNTPAADTLITADVLTLVLTFPFEVTVTGTPSLGVTIGATLRSADYVSGTGTKTLTFTYTIIAADDDIDGITVTGLSLNGGTLTFSNRGIITNCSTTLAVASFGTVLVDNTGPAISAFTQSNIPGFYRVGNTISFLMTFSEKVYVTGVPRIQVAFTIGGAKYATYAGGTGTTSLSFTYVVENTVEDTDGYVITSPLELNSGTIQDGAANAANLSFAGLVAAVQTYSASVDIDGRLPYVVAVTPPANGTYLSAQNLDVTLLFDRAVNITGTPYVGITVGSVSRQAAYFSGTGTNTIVFRYTLIPGDMDADGITIASSITQFGGTIAGVSAPTTSFFTNILNNTLSIPNTTGVLCGAVQPQAITVTRNLDDSAPVWGANPDNVWIIGQQLFVTVGFNTGMLVNQSGGTPRIPITIGATVRYATYLSGGDGQTSLVFRYNIVEGDLDNDASIAIGNIELNGGTLTDSSATNSLLTLPVAAITSTTIDGVKPTIATVTAPPNLTYSEVNLSSFDFTVVWSEAVDYSSTAAAAAYIPLTIGATAINAIYSSGNQTTTFIHTPATIATTNDSDGIVINSPFAGTGTVRDQAGNAANVFTFTPPLSTGVLVDTTAPVVTGVSSPAGGRYVTGNALDFNLTFSESVNIGIAGGAPYIQILIGSNIRNATVTSAGSGTTHTFRYTIVATDTDPDFVTYQTSNITIPGVSFIRDAGLNNLSPMTFSDPGWTGVIVDEVAPAITSASTTAGTYVSGTDGPNTIVISTTFSEPVTVDTAGGTPSIILALATGNVNAIYDVVSSTTTVLKFKHTVLGGSDLDLDGLALAAASIQLNTGVIKDARNNLAILTIGSVTNLNAAFIVPHATVWIKSSTINRSGFTVKPTVSTSASVTSGYYIFNGSTRSLDISSLGPVFAVYMAIKSPAAASIYAQDLIDGKITFDDNTINMTAIDSPNVKISSSYTGTGNSHPSALTTNANQEMELIYGIGSTFPTIGFIPMPFSGGVAEIIIFEAALSPGQKTQAYNYINAAYP
ncbi:MAG TPA: hypothetical protein VNJ08_11235 [Bacteriovoracaceae bacterium]|nr:hypothetical protein [Bacteriovoracaceae bacterium]